MSQGIFCVTLTNIPHTESGDPARTRVGDFENTESDELWIIVQTFRLTTSDKGTFAITHRQEVHLHVTGSFLEL